ncbi:uncharacterized protein LOC123502501 [Portunus trituberculatus]|uniref:uncharacterized protein LOC123502501 n=1 Tax=Portunus trituberculatus TaxID=210409 RepID=UPI001E1CE5B1|nr:uncharacterized protein LOC123502501 [Portunus trituberculatus]
MKRELKRTGGGPPPAAVSNESDQVLAILGSDIEDIGNPYDLDAMPSTAKSHRHGRLIRITKFLFGIGDSSTMVCEVVALDTPQEAMVTPQVAMVEETVMLEKTPGPTTSTPRGKSKRKFNDTDFYLDATEARNVTKERVETQKRMMRKKEYFLDLQIQDMEIRKKETEIRKKEAEVLLQIALKKLENENKNC